MCDIILLDGTCIFCNRLVALILRLDRTGIFGFAHLQGPFARSTLGRHGLEANIDAIYLIKNAGTANEEVLIDGEAGRQIWPRIIWLGALIHLVPLPLLNLFYRSFARVRYRLFGQYETCRAPTAEERARFLE
jgi:predicted DCC family thiol-disulfide oxidoreductase YuxK